MTMVFILRSEMDLAAWESYPRPSCRGRCWFEPTNDCESDHRNDPETHRANPLPEVSGQPIAIDGGNSGTRDWDRARCRGALRRGRERIVTRRRRDRLW